MQKKNQPLKWIDWRFFFEVEKNPSILLQGYSVFTPKRSVIFGAEKKGLGYNSKVQVYLHYT